MVTLVMLPMRMVPVMPLPSNLLLTILDLIFLLLNNHLHLILSLPSCPLHLLLLIPPPPLTVSPILAIALHAKILGGSPCMTATFLFPVPLLPIVPLALRKPRELLHLTTISTSIDFALFGAHKGVSEGALKATSEGAPQGAPPAKISKGAPEGAPPVGSSEGSMQGLLLLGLPKGAPQGVPKTSITPHVHLLQPDLEQCVQPDPITLFMNYFLVSTKNNPDTMTLQEALQQPDEEFIKAMHKELHDHIKRKHWKVVPSSTVAKGKPPLPNFSDTFGKVYKLLKNLYGFKDAGKTWHDYLKKGLEDEGWKPSNIDNCLFTKDGIILVLYIDDAVLTSPSKQLIMKEIKSLQESYVLTDKGELKDYLGTCFNRRPDGSIKFTQPRMIEQVLDIIGLNSHGSKAIDLLCCLNYLHAMVRLDLTIQQCARFCNNLKKPHKKAVCRYLLRTKDCGLIMKPDPSRSLECFHGNIAILARSFVCPLSHWLCYYVCWLSYFMGF